MADQYLSQIQTQRQMQVLAPQLRQSLELLQVPVLELRSLVQQEMEKNPTIEESPAPDAPDSEAESASSEPELPATDGEAPNPAKDSDSDFGGEPEAPTPSATESGGDDEKFQDEFERLVKLDDEWRDYFQQGRASQPYSADDAQRRQFLFDSISQPESLQQHLVNQLSLAVDNEEDRQIGELLIGSINDDGFLTSNLDEMAASTGHTTEQLTNVLELIKEFDPVGIGSKDLQECLLTQLNRLGKEDSIAAQIARDHLEALGARKYAEIARALKISPEQVQDAARLIGTLEPKPGRRFVADAPYYVLPEAMVQKIDGRYVVLLNNDQIPRLHISNEYRRLMGDSGTTSEVKSYIREKIRAGLFLIKSINQRQQTIYNIASEIVKVQTDFFEHGISRLRPLTMNEIAQVVGIHETTVSRAIANKYIQTPRGTFEMKYFFTPGYKTADGKEISNKTIKNALSTLVADEDPATPLSDQAMVQKLGEMGIQVARRTIAKYREELKILPSHLRKQL